jgi:hypothetical protein
VFGSLLFVKVHAVRYLVSVLVLFTSCKGDSQHHEESAAIPPTHPYEYKVGLGYGFLGKVVQVTIDSREVISVVGTDELEQYTQLKGTKMLASGSSPNHVITVRVAVDGDEPYEQAIGLRAGTFVHVYHEGTELRIFNTHFLVLE